MIPILAAIAVVLLGAAAVAMALRSLIHSALCLVLAWSAVAAFYLWAGAEFLAFAQVLIYVGAVSMVVLFAVLLTRRRPDAGPEPGPARRGRVMAGAAVGALVAGVIARAVLAAPLPAPAGEAPTLTTRRLGAELMGSQTAALLVAGVILTVALIGAVVLAAPESGGGRDDAP